MVTETIIEQEADVAEYALLEDMRTECESTIRKFVLKPETCVPFLQVGRLVRLAHQDIWAAILDYDRDDKGLDVTVIGYFPKEKEAQIARLQISGINAISSLIINMPKDLRPQARKGSGYI